jgi:hypothetical protein
LAVRQRSSVELYRHALTLAPRQSPEEVVVSDDGGTYASRDAPP